MTGGRPGRRLVLMNKVLVTVSVVISSVLLSIVGTMLYNVGDLGDIAVPSLGSWAIIVISGFVVVFGFLLGIRYMSSL